MSKKIILFLSDYKQQGTESAYLCPDGSIVCGTQSNEAPVKYLLNRYSDISEILCIVTEQAKTRAWGSFSEEIQKINPQITLTQILFKGETTQEFVQIPMVSILGRIQAGDEILLETTGGFRNAVMYLLLISRVLSYIGVDIISAVYSNYAEKKIEDLSQLIGLFDLVSGMQELSSFGAVKNIRTYYEGLQYKDDKVEELLYAVEELMETITLCRTNLIDKKMREFNRALNGAEECSDVLFQQLLPAFRRKFGEELTILSLIEWCVESGMIQQALTIYTERIPAYIISGCGFLKVDATVQRPAAKSYEDKEAVLFLRGFLNLSQNSLEAEFLTPIDQLRNYIGQNEEQILMMQRGLTRGLQKKYKNLQRPINNIIVLLNASYGSATGAFIPSWTKRLEKDKQFLAKIKSWYDKNPPHEAIGMIRKFAIAPKEVLMVLMEQQEEPIPKKKESPYVYTLNHLEKLLPGSGFQVIGDMEGIRVVSRDYLYIKTLRNLANHANEEETAEQKLLLEDLYKHGYKELSQVKLQDIKDVILQGIQHLQS